MTRLERRYRRLLWTFPAEHRAEHESEILDTLLQAAAPGQRWPSPREAAALLVGGLRVQGWRTAADPAARWADGLRLGVLLVVLLLFGSLAGHLVALSPLGYAVGQRGSFPPGWQEAFVIGLLGLAVTRGRIRAALLLSAAYLAMGLAANLQAGLSGRAVVVGLVSPGWLVLAGILALLGWHPPYRAAARPWPWRILWLGLLAGGPTALLPFWSLLGPTPWPLITVAVVTMTAIPVVVLVAAALAAADPRPAIGATVLVAIRLLFYLGLMALPLPDIADQWTRVGVEIAATLLLAGAAAAVAFTTGRRVAIC